MQSNAGIFLETLLTRFMATIVMYLVPFGLYSIVTQQMEKEQGLSTEVSFLIVIPTKYRHLTKLTYRNFGVI